MNSENLENSSTIVTGSHQTETLPTNYEVNNSEFPKKQFIEPVLFLLNLSTTLFDSVILHVIELQFCSAILNLSNNSCLNAGKDSLHDLQKFISMFQIVRSLIEVLVPGVISFFVGTWSDAVGRKPLMLSSAIGYSLVYISWSLGLTVTSLDPMYFLLFSVPLGLSGAKIVLTLSVFCYVCDITSSENRAVRMGRNQSAIFLGSFFGSQLTPLILIKGYYAVIIVATVGVCLTTLYIFFCVDESIVKSQIELSTVSRNPFKWKYIRNLVESCFVKQTSKIRLTVAIIITVVTLFMMEIYGESNILFLYLQNILGWNLEHYITFNSNIVLINAFGAGFGTWLLFAKLKLHDLFVLGVATVMQLISSFIMLLGSNLWQIYLAKIMTCASGISELLVKLFLSKIIPKDDLGKIFSLIASVEAFTPLIATLIYSSLYNVTLSAFPRAVFLLSAIILLIMTLLLIILMKMYIPNGWLFDKKDSSRVPTNSLDPSSE